MRNVSQLVFGIVIVGLVIITAGCQSESTEPVSPTTVSATTSVPAEPKAPAKVKEEKTASDKNAPCITFENPVHDFGQMGPDTSQKCQFKFSNTGKSVLKIETIQSTCGCTVPELAKKEYAPGESGAIDVTFHSGKYGATYTKHLYVVSNDPATPRVELTIKAKVVIMVVVDPNRVELALNKDNAGLGTLTVKSIDGTPFAITNFTATGQSITCPFDVNEKKTVHVLNPRADMKKLQDITSGMVQIGVDHPQAKEVVVGFSVLAAYELRPARIILQNAVPGVTTKREVWIVNNYDQAFEIESITSRNNYMKVIDQKKEGLNIALNIEITPPQQQEPVRRYITDELNIKIKDGPMLTVRCSGWFKLK